MEETVRQDILNILKDTLKNLDLEYPNAENLKKTSDHIIHNASIFQDEDSISIATLIYSLAKIVERINEKFDYKKIKNLISCAIEYLEDDNTDTYRDFIKQIFTIIAKTDAKYKQYVQEVIRQASLKKGSRIYEHGISASKAAEIMQLSIWELYSYLGATEVPDSSDLASVRERLKFARGLKNATIILDSGPVISLALNNLLWVLAKTKKEYNLKFYMTEAVKSELVDHPLTIKRFQFEALQIMKLIREEVIEVVNHPRLKEKTLSLLDIANNSFSAKDHDLTLVHFAEVSAISAALLFDAEAMMIDERTTRYLLERPERLRLMLNHKLHTPIEINKEKLSILKKETRNIRFIRSAEFIAVCFEKGLLDEYLPNLPDSKKMLLDSLIWGLKMNGCAISEKDLNLLINIEMKDINKR